MTHLPDTDPQLTYEARGDRYRLAVLTGRELSYLLPLFHDVFGRRRFSADWLERKYAVEHGGARGFACAAFAQDGSPAGCVGMLPWPIRLGDRVETAAQIADVATGSVHRGRGLAVRLDELAREVCEAQGVTFIFGFPTETAFRIWLSKLGYLHVDDLVVYRIPVRTLWAERAAPRIPALKRFYARYVERTLSAYAPADRVLENTLLRDGFAGTERDRAFYEYKSSFAGSRVVSLGGGRVWLAVRRGLLVGDFEAASSADLERTVRELIELARRLGAHQIVFQASKLTRFSELLPGRFHRSPGLPLIHKNLRSAIPHEKLRFTFGDLDNF